MIFQNFIKYPFALSFAGAGPAGGKIGSRTGSDTPGFVLRLLRGQSTSWQFREKMRSYEVPEKMSLVINNSCNLACRHCYLQVGKLTAEPLSVDEWKLAATSIINGGSPFIALAGKEVFLGKKNLEILRTVHALNELHGHHSRLGLITNGTLMAPYREFLKGMNLDYLDISLDGTPEDHDAVRGKGAFASARPNVEWAAREMPKPFFLSMTLQKQNIGRITPALETFSSMGISHVGLSFYVPTSRTDPALKLSSRETEVAIRELSSLGNMQLQRPMTVIVELNTHTPEGLEAFIQSPWFDPSKLTTDKFDNLWVEHRLPNGLLLQFKVLVLPSSIFRVARITPEGNYLASDDIFETDLYDKRILGNLRDHRFNFLEMHETAKKHPRTSEILDEYEDLILPRLRQAYSQASETKMQSPMAVA